MEEKKISKAVIQRLPRYYRYLGQLQEEEYERISSSELSDKMNVTASQIRQDLNNFGGFGQQGYGYNVKYLYDEIGKILGVDKKKNAIIIGAGNLGQAIANYSAFEKRGFVFKAMFDVNPILFGKKFRGIPVYALSQLEKFIAENEISTAVLTIPKSSVIEITNKLIEYGIKAFWNFAHIDLQLPKGIAVENVHLSESLMRLSYKLTSIEENTDKEE